MLPIELAEQDVARLVLKPGDLLDACPGRSLAAVLLLAPKGKPAGQRLFQQLLAIGIKVAGKALAQTRIDAQRRPGPELLESAFHPLGHGRLTSLESEEGARPACPVPAGRGS